MGAAAGGDGTAAAARAGGQDGPAVHAWSLYEDDAGATQGREAIGASEGPTPPPRFPPLTRRDYAPLAPSPTRSGAAPHLTRTPPARPPAQLVRPMSG